MNESPDDARHLTFTTLDSLWSAGNPVVLPVQGDPACRLELDPKNGLITLVTSYQSPAPDVARLKNVSFQALADGSEELAELTVHIEGNVHGAYGLLATIADEVQIAKAPLAAAVASGVARYKDVLAVRVGLTAEKEIGLYGELLFLEYLIRTLGSGPALMSWQGPLSEEHDFAFDSVHLEVKTTSTERRRHTIHGLTQLVPLRGVPLSLVSIQLTRSSPDGGRSLPGLIAHVRKIAGGHVVPLDRCLAVLGWKPEDSDLYPTYWTLRSPPRAYRVDGDFPAMTPASIERVVPNFGLLSEVTYKVDLTDFPPSDIPDSAIGFVESKES